MLVDTLQELYYIWRSKKHSEKIIIFQSDDWGMECNVIRGSKSAESLRSYETIETVNDINALIQLLSFFKDEKGNHPIFTLNFIMGNPDYDLIKESDYTEYKYIPISKGFNHTSENLIESYKEGVDKKIFSPAYHGLVHFNTSQWLSLLRLGDKIAHRLFEQRMWITYFFTNDKGYDLKSGNYGLDNQQPCYLNADGYYSREYSGIEIFKNIFGKYPTSYIAPQYYLSRLQFDFFRRHDSCHTLQASTSLSDFISGKRFYNYHGQKKKSVLGLFRNARFEPWPGKKRKADYTLRQIDTAFKYNLPAIIDTHRINYITGLDAGIKDNNLNELYKLLDAILKKYPDASFMSTEQYIDMYFKKFTSTVPIN